VLPAQSNTLNIGRLWASLHSLTRVGGAVPRTGPKRHRARLWIVCSCGCSRFRGSTAHGHPCHLRSERAQRRAAPAGPFAPPALVVSGSARRPPRRSWER
jgi:hypothetical protein